jgi:hypothetical protein
MSEKSLTVLVIAVIVLCCASCSSSNVSSSRAAGSEEKMCSTFAVMPFYYPSYFPYTLDRLRESLINALRARGLNRDYWETNWERVDTLNISFVNLNEEQADTIARLLEVDLLITGEIRNNVTFHIQHDAFEGIPRQISKICAPRNTEGYRLLGAYPFCQRFRRSSEGFRGQAGQHGISEIAPRLIPFLTSLWATAGEEPTPFQSHSDVVALLQEMKPPRQIRHRDGFLSNSEYGTAYSVPQYALRCFSVREIGIYCQVPGAKCHLLNLRWSGSLRPLIQSALSLSSKIL